MVRDARCGGLPLRWLKKVMFEFERGGFAHLTDADMRAGSFLHSSTFKIARANSELTRRNGLIRAAVDRIAI